MPCPKLPAGGDSAIGSPSGVKSWVNVCARMARLPAAPSVHTITQRPSSRPTMSGANASPPGPPFGSGITEVEAGTVPVLARPMRICQLPSALGGEPAGPDGVVALEGDAVSVALPSGALAGMLDARRLQPVGPREAPER